ncbi:hypothetical protein ANRL1_00005 [Anaerolineae bacterium]|nr:hypothetical protein ANRL1_00005 [Anaerolineae bacterium]
MTLIQFVVLAIVAVAATLPAVLLIPRARQSPAFDRVLWGATWLLAFFSALAAPGYIAADALPIRWIIGEVAMMPALIGAVVGAFAINLALWLMDHFSQSPLEESDIDEEENVGDDSTQ